MLQKHPRKYSLRSLWILLLITLRSRSVITLALVIVIPTSITTVLILGSEVVQGRVSEVSDIVTGTTVVARVTRTSGVEGHIIASITDATISNGEDSVEASVVVTEDVSDYLKFFKTRVIKSLSKFINTSIGIELAQTLKVGIGDYVTVCLSNSCKNLIIDSIHSCRCILDYSLLVRSNLSVGPALVFRELPREVIAFGILASTSGDLSKLMYTLSVMTMISYIVLIYLGFRRLTSSIRNDVFLIHELGISLRSIRSHFAIVAATLSLLLSLYGTALGLVITHLSIWVLRFLDVYLPLRPTLPYPWLALLSLMIAAIALPVGYITSRSWEYGG